MAEVKWTFQAIEDINNIAAYISRDSARYAQIQVARFFDAVLILEEHSRSGRVVPEIKNSNIRELILGNYRIIYKIVNSNTIDILTVHHSVRLFKKSMVLKK